MPLCFLIETLLGPPNLSVCVSGTAPHVHPIEDLLLPPAGPFGTLFPPALCHPLAAPRLSFRPCACRFPPATAFGARCSGTHAASLRPLLKLDCRCSLPADSTPIARLPALTAYAVRVLSYSAGAPSISRLAHCPSGPWAASVRDTLGVSFPDNISLARSPAPDLLLRWDSADRHSGPGMGEEFR